MSQDNWKDVKSKVEGLGLKLKLHLEQEADETNDEANPGDTKAAIEELGTKLQDAFASFGAAAKDQAVRDDVKDIGLTLKDAMYETLSTVGGEVGEAVKKARGEAPSTGDADAGTSTGDDTNS